MIQISPEIKSLLEKSIIAFGTADKLMRPNVIAISDGCQVVGPNQVLIVDNYFNKTYKNIQDNSQVSLSFWDVGGHIAFQLKGNAQYMTSGDWKKRIDKLPNPNHNPRKGAVLINITEIWDLANPKLIVKEN